MLLIYRLFHRAHDTVFGHISISWSQFGHRMAQMALVKTDIKPKVFDKADDKTRVSSDKCGTETR
jgi:hypothetical protein